MDWETSGRQGRREEPAEHTFWYVSRPRSAGRWIARWITVHATLFRRAGTARGPRCGWAPPAAAPPGDRTRPASRRGADHRAPPAPTDPRAVAGGSAAPG